MGRRALLAFNTGTELSGSGGHIYPGRAAAWDPTSNRWTGLPNAPLAGYQTVAVWTGKSLLIWGQLVTPRGANHVATTGLEFGPWPTAAGVDSSRSQTRLRTRLRGANEFLRPPSGDVRGLTVAYRDLR